MTLEASYLRYLTYKGCIERYDVDVELQLDYPPDARDTLSQRIEHELATIDKARFPGYFLIVADILRFCRENGIPTGPGRGSICGSAVAYAVKITDVEPIRFGIPFERFLHLERIQQPDIDLDICQARRDEVIQYLRSTYGADSVAQIITFTPLNAKGVVRDVCRVLHVDDELRGVKSNETGEKLAASIPEGSGADQVKLTEFLESKEGVEFGLKIRPLVIKFEGDDISVLDTCLALEGLRRHGGVHAAGVVIADRPLIDIVPLYRKNQDADIQIQYDMRDSETLGLLKMDVLGLRTVTVLGEAEALVRRKYGEFSIKSVPLDDHKTFELLSRGDTGAVFQLEGDGITAACVGMQPDRFEDIVALIALYRPGPMEQLGDYFRRKHGEDPVTYAHPLLTSILSTTYGLIVYQEQVMGIVRALGGYTAGEADQFRKAIGKKLAPLIKEKIDEFILRAMANGHDEHIVRAIGDQIFYFGRYGFNLGHATGYGFITYWTAYLKANHPTEFFTANLNSQLGVLDKIGTLLRDAGAHGISILSPDINLSGTGFTLVSESATGQPTILFGLGAIKGLGDSMVTDIVEYRDAATKNQYSSRRVIRTKDDGTAYQANIRNVERVLNEPRPYSGIGDFCARLTHIPINAKANLVMAGAFGSDMDFRRKLLSCLSSVNTAAKSKRPIKLETDPANEPTALDIMRGEKEVLGFYITAHPLGVFKDDLARYGATVDGRLDDLHGSVVIGGLVIAIREHPSKRGKMAWVTLESGIEGLPDITIFSDLWDRVSHNITKDKIVVVRGNKKYDVRFGWGIIANDVIIVNRAKPDADVIHINLYNADTSDLMALKHMQSEDGANVQVAVGAPNGRIALIATGILLPSTGAAISGLEDSGWDVHIDPSDISEVQWEGKNLTMSKSLFSGSGTDRISIAEVPIVKRALQILDANLMGELRTI